MNADSIQDSTRYVVGALHRGSILPGSRAEMWRDVYLENGADVQGGIWCGSLSVLGSDVSVSESVYSRGAVRIAVDDGAGLDGNAIEFGSCLTSSDSLIIANAPCKVRFRSDIYTDQLSISNAFVYGNVFANRAIIRDSVVLGGIFCRDQLTLERSLVSTFDTGRANVGEGTSLFFPGAIARDGINLTAPVRILTFYELDQQQDGFGGQAVLLDETDVIELNASSTLDGDEADGPRLLYCLSAVERVLDSAPVREHLAFNRQFLERLALRGHLVPGASDDRLGDPTSELEAALWNILSRNPVDSSQRVGSSIDELFARLGANG